MSSRREFQILLVEDNPADAGLITRFLANDVEKALKIHWVKDGLEALQFLEQQEGFQVAPRPDIVLLDLNLPKKDGWEVLKELKSKPHLQNIPVLVLTTSNAERDVERAYSLNANSFLVKPSDLTKFQSLFHAITLYWMEAVQLPSPAAYPTGMIA